MSSQLMLKRSVPVRFDVDVFVAGGGPAGVAAAVAAARRGARVFLAEGHTCFGGAGTAGLIPAFCNFDDGKNFLIGGIGAELCDMVTLELGQAQIIHAETLKRKYDDMVAASGVEFLLQTNFLDVEREGGRVTHALCASKSGVFAVRAKSFVDCTGDGDLSVAAGAEFDKGDENGNLMPGTMCAEWCNIDWANREPNQKQFVERAIEEGVFSEPDRHIMGMAETKPGLYCGNIGHVFGLDGSDDVSLTKGLMRGRALLVEIEAFFKKYVRGHQNMSLAASASLMGIRETRRIRGEYTLCIDDFRSMAVFDDEIGRYSYPVDIHPSTGDKEAYDRFLKEHMENYRYKNPGENYGIPYRSLVVGGLDNVLVAGRCISSDRRMQSSVRVMPACWITGQAAGTAAAIAAETGSRCADIDITTLHKALKKLGAFIPNAKV